MKNHQYYCRPKSKTSATAFGELVSSQVTVARFSPSLPIVPSMSPEKSNIFIAKRFFAI